jgi:hypothetical protein
VLLLIDYLLFTIVSDDLTKFLAVCLPRPHEDGEISVETNTCFKSFFFALANDLRNIKKQFVDYSLNSGVFARCDAIEDRAHFDSLSYLCVSLAYSFIWDL